MGYQRSVPPFPVFNNSGQEAGKRHCHSLQLWCGSTHVTPPAVQIQELRDWGENLFWGQEVFERCIGPILIGINRVQTQLVCNIGVFCINRFEPLFLENKINREWSEWTVYVSTFGDAFWMDKNCKMTDLGVWLVEIQRILVVSPVFFRIFYTQKILGEILEFDLRRKSVETLMFQPH